MLSPRSPPVPHLRIACLGQTRHSPRSLPNSGPATFGRRGFRHVPTALVSISLGGSGGSSTDRHGPSSCFQHRCRRHDIIQSLRQTQQVRGKKTTTVVKLEDLPQGLIAPLEPAISEPRAEDDEPAYPTVVLQARRNMQKFDNCVVLTRVGGFYEIYLEQAEEYGPLLNLKVAHKKTSAGPVPMVLFPCLRCGFIRPRVVVLGCSDGFFCVARPASPFSSWIASSRSWSRTSIAM